MEDAEKVTSLKESAKAEVGYFMMDRQLETLDKWADAYVKELEEYINQEIHSGMTPAQMMQVVLRFLRGKSK